VVVVVVVARAIYLIEARKRSTPIKIYLQKRGG